MYSPKAIFLLHRTSEKTIRHEKEKASLHHAKSIREARKNDNEYVAGYDKKTDRPNNEQAY